MNWALAIMCLYPMMLRKFRFLAKFRCHASFLGAFPFSRWIRQRGTFSQHLKKCYIPHILHPQKKILLTFGRMRCVERSETHEMPGICVVSLFFVQHPGAAPGPLEASDHE